MTWTRLWNWTRSTIVRPTLDPDPEPPIVPVDEFGAEDANLQGKYLVNLEKVSIWSKILNSKSVFSAIFAWILDPPPRQKRKTSPKTVTATVRKTTRAQWSWLMIVGLQASNCQIPRKTRSLGQLQLCPNYAAKSALPMLELVLKSCWTWPTPIQSMRISHPLGNVQKITIKNLWPWITMLKNLQAKHQAKAKIQANGIGSGQLGQWSTSTGHQKQDWHDQAKESAQ